MRLRSKRSEKMEEVLFDRIPGWVYDFFWVSAASAELIRRGRHRTAGWLYCLTALVFCGFGGSTTANLILGRGVTAMWHSFNLLIIACSFFFTVALPFLSHPLYSRLVTPLVTMSGATCIIGNYARAVDSGVVDALPLIIISSMGGYGSGLSLAYEDRLFSKRLLRSEYASNSIKYSLVAASIYHITGNRLYSALTLVFFQTTRAWGYSLDPLAPFDKVFGLLIGPEPKPPKSKRKKT